MKKILLIGEFCIDRFISVDNVRLSPEATSLVGCFSSVLENDGMAGNVCRNLLSLSNKDVEVIHLKNETNIIKTRYIDVKNKHIIFRYDEHDYVKHEEQLNESKFIKEINDRKLKMKDFSAIVISSYNKGLVDKNFLNFIFNVANQYNIPTFGDFKFILGEWSKELFCCKINSLEMKSQYLSLKSPEFYCQNLIVTHSGDGAFLYQRGESPCKFPVEKVDVNSVVGAGDTFLSGLVIRYLETQDLLQSIEFANKAAAKQVTKTGVGIVNRYEI